jgi:hypothetical protein
LVTKGHGYDIDTAADDNDQGAPIDPGAPGLFFASCIAAGLMTFTSEGPSRFRFGMLLPVAYSFSSLWSAFAWSVPGVEAQPAPRNARQRKVAGIAFMGLPPQSYSIGIIDQTHRCA